MAETSGLVQQLKWAPDSRAVFVYLGPAPTATRLFLILFDTDDGNDLAFRRSAAQLLGKARSAGFAVTLQHDNNSIITGVDTRIRSTMLLLMLPSRDSLPRSVTTYSVV